MQIFQSTIKEKDQTIMDQTTLIARLSAKVENSEDAFSTLKEQLDKAQHDLKLESDKFDLKLRETQKYFEETLQEQEAEINKMRETLKNKDADLMTRENDLSELISRHQKDIERIMSKGEVNIHDHVLQMLEQKLKDINEVLDGKIKVIEVLQKDVSEKDKQLAESHDIQKSFKEKLQVTSEQMMLMNANMVDMEMQWKDEKKKLDEKIRGLIEKHETENTEKDLNIHTLYSQLQQYQNAYSQAAIHYNNLQERFQHMLKPGGAVPATPEQAPLVTLPSTLENDSSNQLIAELKERLKEKDKELVDMENYKKQYEQLQVQLAEKEVAEAAKKPSEEETTGKSETKMLKMKAQLTSKIKALEKELDQLRKVCILFIEHTQHTHTTHTHNTHTLHTLAHPMHTHITSYTEI